MNKPYQFVKQGEDVTELLIYGDITSFDWYESDTGAYSFAKDLAEIDTDIIVRINSYGGEVAEGLAIYNQLKAFKHNVTTVCDGFACSAASVIFMAGAKRIMPNSSLLLIHNAWTWTAGDSNELRKQADDLEKITQPSVEIYKSVATISEEEIKSMMDEETWITAEEALSYGFATEIQKIEAQQKAEDKMMYSLVMKCKQLEKKLQENSCEEQDAWKSYFKGKRS
ncbi:MAG: Clp protease ClpP [Erysipelotrichaceae bacterium]|nr:Clp protease ClpP [Erysipelotrichaceae bacterium]